MLGSRVRRGIAGIGGAIFVLLILASGYVGELGLWALAIGVVGALITVGVAAVDTVWGQQQRRDANRFAERHGWSSEEHTREYDRRFTTFPFDGGTESRAEIILRGTLNGVQCASFTHIRASADNEGHKLEEPFQVALVEIPVDLPFLELVPESVAQKFAKAFGGRDLDVESHEFNRQWRVVCGDPRYAHSVLHPRMIQRLLQPDALELTIRIEHGAILVWQGGRLATDSLARRLEVATGIARRIPEHVVRTYGTPWVPRGAGRFRAYPPTAPAWATTPGALTSRKPTGVEPGPAATGEGFHGLPDDRPGFDIFRAATYLWP